MVPEVLKVNTEIVQRDDLITGIKTLLNTISITL